MQTNAVLDRPESVWNFLTEGCGSETLVLISVIITKRSGVMTVRVDDFRPAVDSDHGSSQKAAGNSCSLLN